MKVDSPLAKQISVEVTDPPGILSFPQGKCVSRRKNLVCLGNSQEEEVQENYLYPATGFTALCRLLKNIILKMFY